MQITTSLLIDSCLGFTARDGLLGFLTTASWTKNQLTAMAEALCAMDSWMDSVMRWGFAMMFSYGGRGCLWMFVVLVFFVFF